MNNDNQPGVFETLVESATDYAETRAKLLRLKAIRKTSDLASDMISHVLVAGVLAIFLLLLSVGLSLWIGKLLGAHYLGFFIMAGAYLLIALILMARRRNFIKVKLRDAIIKTVNS